MLEHHSVAPPPNCGRLLALSCASLLVLGAGEARALPPSEPGAAPGLLLAQGAPPDSEQQAQADRKDSLADLNEVLEATRAKLEELFEATATATATSELREQLQALKQDKERLAAELQQANARRTEIERSSERAEARIAELAKAVDQATQEATRHDGELARLRRQNAQLNQSLAQAHGARQATRAEAEQAVADMEAKLEAATATIQQSQGELAELRTELEATRERLAAADDAREQSVARVSAMEEAVQRSGSEAERLQAELAAVKQQLGQAAVTAIEAQRARQAASSEADSLRAEAGRARVELTAARAEVDRFKSTNTDLEKQIASWHRDSRSAIETARRNLTVVEEKIEELNAVLGVGSSKTAATVSSPEAMPGPAADEPGATGPEAASPTAQPVARGPAAESRDDQPSSGSATERATAMPTAAASSEAASSELTRFHANIEDLNERALDAAGADLFSEIETVSDEVVQVGTTTAWASVPPAGQRSYLNSLLDYWVAAKGGEGPAVVRIVDQDDQVLLEKSWP
jgi:myosin heavy subunit